jgi:hypothetical protein
MKGIKHELQSIIIGNGQDGNSSQLKKVQNFLRGNAQASSKPQEQEYLKSVQAKIYIIRGKQVMMDSDLAEL